MKRSPRAPRELTGPVTWRDRVRQVLVLLTAVAQILASVRYGPSVGEVARENASAILPAGYAFAIWGPIFALSLAIAIIGFAPALTPNPALRKSGRILALAFAADAVWVLVFSQRQFVLAQLVLVVGLVTAVRATVRLQRTTDGDRTVAVLFGGTYGLLAGWLTAATFVGLANALVAWGMTGDSGWSGVVGVVLLLVATAVAAGVVRACATGPLPGSLAYAAAVVWGFAAIAVENKVSFTAITALVLALVLLGYLGAAYYRRRHPRPIRRLRRPRVPRAA